MTEQGQRGSSYCNPASRGMCAHPPWSSSVGVRLRVRGALVLALAALLLANPGAARTDPEPESSTRPRVGDALSRRAAVRAGRAWLQSASSDVARWSFAGESLSPSSVEGACALGVLALVGREEREAAVRPHVDALIKRNLRGVYSLSLRAVATARGLGGAGLPDERRAAWTRSLTADLLTLVDLRERRGERGESGRPIELPEMWGYPGGSNVITTGFAAWALVSAPTFLPSTHEPDWRALSRSIRRLQVPGCDDGSAAPKARPSRGSADAGGVGYSLERLPLQPNGWRTACALLTLTCARSNLLRGRPDRGELALVDTAIRCGATWLGNEFSPHVNPRGRSGRDFYGYLLFLRNWSEAAPLPASLWSRAAWREEASAVVVKRQARSGAWEGGDPIATALAILFLADDVAPALGAPLSPESLPTSPHPTTPSKEGSLLR